MEEIKNQLLLQELRQYFKPEFLNRFDGIVTFKPLSQEHIEQIAKLLLNSVQKRLLNKGIYLEATPAAVKELAEKGFDPLFGARPLKRVIQEQVDNALANFLLTGKISRRDKVILEKGGVLRIEKAEKF
jgi:ATP-dependent Clp protease ATP-binding subunit ClpA